MRVSAGSSRMVRIAVVALFVVCLLQATWWLVDQARWTSATRERLLVLHEGRRGAGQALLDAGRPAREVETLFPELEVSAAPDPRASLRAETLEALESERWHRLNRYGWEGAFFLVVLGAGMAVILRALKQEAELARRQQEVLAAVSHEFKSPLASLRLAAETLRLRDPEPVARRRLLGRLLDDVARLELVVGNTLGDAELEHGGVRLSPEPLDARRLAEAARDELAERAREAGVEIDVGIRGELWLLADPVAARAALRNLLDNALEAVDGNAAPSIRVLATREGAYVRLDVSDNGRGFPPELAERLFDRFVQHREPGARRSGTGLGLSIVRRFAELSGGFARGASAGAGRGACFSVAWPAADTAPGAGGGA